MTYLLAKIAILLLISSIGGALLMWWWLRRKYVDVTVSFAQSDAKRQAAVSDLEELRRKYKTLEQDFASKIDSVLGKVNPLQDKIKDVDANSSIANLEQKLLSIQSQLSSLPQPKQTNLKPVLSALTSLKMPEAKEIDLSSVLNAISRIRIPEAKETDLSPVMDAISQIHVPETNLAPLRRAINNIPAAKPVDLSPLHAEIKAIKAELAKRPKEAVKTIIKKAPVRQKNAVVANRLGNRGNRLRKAAFGNPDDLKVIRGVGPKLEKMLRGIGVYYYWQVADWSKDDVQEVNELLNTFKGRIKRDKWVAQAKKLTRLSSSAVRP